MILTKREEQVIRELMKDVAQKEVADRMGMSYPTVKAHLLNARTKNHCRTTIGLVVALLRQPVSAGTWEMAGLGEGHT